MQIGLDIGSTTIKIAVLDDAGKLLFAKYQRHYSQIAEKIQELLQELFVQFPLLKLLVCTSHIPLLIVGHIRISSTTTLTGRTPVS